MSLEVITAFMERVPHTSTVQQKYNASHIRNFGTHAVKSKETGKMLMFYLTTKNQNSTIPTFHLCNIQSFSNQENVFHTKLSKSSEYCTLMAH